MRKELVPITALVFVVFICNSASAQVTRQSDSATFATIQAAHDDAGTAAGETLLVTAATLAETNIIITKDNITIDGQGNTIDGGGSATDVIVNVTAAGITTNIQNVTLTSAVRNVSVAASAAGTTVNLVNCDLEDTSEYNLHSDGPALTLNVTDCVVRNGGFGLSFAADATATLDNTQLQNTLTGGYLFTVWAGNMNITLQNDSLIEPSVWSAIYFAGRGTLTFDNSSVLNVPAWGFFSPSVSGLTTFTVQNGSVIEFVNVGFYTQANNLNIQVSDSLLVGTDDPIDIKCGIWKEGNGSVAVANSNIHHVSRAIHLLSAGNVVDVSYSIISDWQVAGLNNQAGATVIDDYNVYVDSNGVGSALVNAASGANTVDSFSLTEVFCSTNPVSPEYLHIKDTGPAYDIDGGGNDAGAFPSCGSAVKDWELY